MDEFALPHRDHSSYPPEKPGYIEPKLDHKIDRDAHDTPKGKQNAVEPSAVRPGAAAEKTEVEEDEG